MRPLQGRGASIVLIGGVAPGYYLVPLQGAKNTAIDLTPRHSVSEIMDSYPRENRLPTRRALSASHLSKILFVFCNIPALFVYLLCYQRHSRFGLAFSTTVLCFQ
jgi:hypothetical protein